MNNLLHIKLKLKAKDLLVKKLLEEQYAVTSQADDKLLCTVNMIFEMCDCFSGQGGTFCKHMRV